MAKFENLANSLFGNNRAEEENIIADGETHTLIGTATTDSADGSVMVELSSDVTNPDPIEIGDEVYYGDASTSVELPTTTNVQEGDEVLVSVYGGTPLRSPVVTGVVGSGDRTFTIANNAATAAEAAETMAGEAKEVAEAVGQHFWHDTDGAHVTEVTQEDWNDSTSTDYHSGPNSLINSLGMLIRNGLTNLAAFLSSGVAIYDGNGNDAANISAMFSADGAVIGAQGTTQAVTSPASFTLRNGDGTPLFDVNMLGAQEALIGAVPVSLTNHASVNPPTYGQGEGYAQWIPPATDEYLMQSWIVSIPGQAVGTVNVTGTGVVLPQSEALYTSNTILTPISAYSLCSIDADITIGQATTLTGAAAVSTYGQTYEGGIRLVLTYDGASTIKADLYMGRTEFSGRFGVWGTTGYSYDLITYMPSYSLGTRPADEISGALSTIAGESLYASSAHQFAMGRYNVRDARDTYAFIIGNGTSDTARSNALAVDWSGNVTGGTLNGVDVTTVQSDLSTAQRNITTLQGNVSDIQTAIADTGWQVGTYASEFKNYNSAAANAPRYRRIGNMVYFYGIASPASQLTDAQHNLFTLPTGYRPTGATRYCGMQQASGMNRWLLRVGTNGVVQAERYGTTTSGVFPSGAWMPFSGFFMI